MKQKLLPAFITHPWLVACCQSKFGRICTNWVLQGMRYMNPVEAGYKIILDIFLTGVWWFCVFRVDSTGAWIIAWLLAHTTNWLCNGQPIAMRRHLDWGRNDPRHFIGYVEGLERRVQGRPYLAAVAAFGSLSKGNYRETSDIDIRFVMNDGFVNKVRSAHFCCVERLRAALFLFPLDLYAFELDELKRKMKQDEVPVVFSDPHNLLSSSYKETVSFDAFRQSFRRKILGEAQP